MTLETRTLDCAFEWLLPKIGTYQATVLNDKDGEQLDAVAALCVWCLRLRYNLVDYNIDGIDSHKYPAWNGYHSIAQQNIYATVQKMARDYKVHGGVTPDYKDRNHKDISKWSYKRIFGPDFFSPIHFDVDELWSAVQHMFPTFIPDVPLKPYNEQEFSAIDRIDSNFLEFEMYNHALANLVSTF